MRKKSNKKPTRLTNLLFWGVLRRRKCSADIINYAYSIYYWRQCRSTAERIEILKEFLLSPFSIYMEIKNWSVKLGKTANYSDKSLLRQRLEQFYLAYFYSINPITYYLQEFYRKDGLTRARNYVNRNAYKHSTYMILGLHGKMLYKDMEVCSLGKKVSFFKFCQKRNIPTAPVLMEFLADKTVKDYSNKKNKSGKLPEQDIFCKPNTDKGGKGAEVWLWKGNQTYQRPDGKVLTEDNLRKRLFKKAKEHAGSSFIVQPLIIPHPDLAPFRINATPTLRIISYVDSKGSIQIDSSMFKFSLNPASVVDNAHAGGLVAPVDVETGVLGAASDSNIESLGKRWDKHVVNNTQIKGRLLPYWNETVKVVKHAHSYFSYRLIIGWDVLITKDGPVILEANGQPGLSFIQKAYLSSMGSSGLGNAMAFHLSKAISYMYNGIIGSGAKSKKEGSVDLYSGLTVKKWISWFLINDTKAVRLIIHGKVQGVNFRKWLCDQANSRRVDGWVCNNDNGTVEAVLRGRAVDIEDLFHECCIGSKEASVTQIKASWYKNDIKPGFKVLPGNSSRQAS
ncbi:sugar-transfer associated ATP-grasp domain-containing protein [Dethiobacter alkaliphilus]|uniref:sugar-transfer associated ATP-grasp domain-containing protein n=1 Tax=Dethiobacter alkaliphilus TaxID=427926 RepID=UPI00222635E7|nr:sugar-transfer associated ATP-grasp domain-containing protein [Dethiobacter alkaliphilus]MCW3488821.1 acylphosphatase [Dethiobacter alkaliphilus]